MMAARRRLQLGTVKHAIRISSSQEVKVQVRLGDVLGVLYPNM
jgi:hypothetical protein